MACANSPPAVAISREESRDSNMKCTSLSARRNVELPPRLTRSTRLLSADEVYTLMSNAQKNKGHGFEGGASAGGMSGMASSARTHRLASTDGVSDACGGSSAGLDEYSDITSDGTLSRCTSTDRISLADGQVEDRFRVDRRKLEAMILGCPPDPCDFEIMRLPIGSDGRILSADDFFARIMETTSTDIRYPRMLKVGARNRKDPHVRIVGAPENVSMASQLIRCQLEPHNKITMKMDVSWTHHSHIIGKAGNTIQPVVRRTGVSIHFPDGNKSNETKKSNQVSINSRGDDLSGLEVARSSIRSLTPLIFSFQLKANAQFITLSEPAVLVSHIQGLFNVQVELSVTSDSNPLLLGSVRGSEQDVSRVKEATMFLLRNICGSLATQMPVQMKIEVSPQHHSFIMGRHNDTLKKIMATTDTNITFPDVNNPDLPPLQRSTITISGNINNVYTARQNIVGALPLTLMFEVSNNESKIEDVIKVMAPHSNITIVPKPVRHDGRRPVIIRGPEREADKIYEAWKLATGSDHSVPNVKIPASYRIADYPLQSPSLNSAPGGWPSALPSPRHPMSPFTPPPFTPSFAPPPPTPTYGPPNTPLMAPSPMWPHGGHTSAPPIMPSVSTSFPFPAPHSSGMYYEGQRNSYMSSLAGMHHHTANSPSYQSMHSHGNHFFPPSMPPPLPPMSISDANNNTTSNLYKFQLFKSGANMPPTSSATSNYLSTPTIPEGVESPKDSSPLGAATNSGGASPYGGITRTPLHHQGGDELLQRSVNSSGGSTPPATGGAVCSPLDSSGARDSSPEMVVLGHIQSPPLVGGSTEDSSSQRRGGHHLPAHRHHASPQLMADGSAAVSPTTASNRQAVRNLSSLLSEFTDWRAPGAEKELEVAIKKLSISDYEAKQILANKAMREPVGGTVRVPTSNWSGYGFSKSSPSYQMRQQFQQAGLLKKTINKTNVSQWQQQQAAAGDSSKVGEQSLWNDTPASSSVGLGGVDATEDRGAEVMDDWPPSNTGDSSTTAITKWSINDGSTSSAVSRVVSNAQDSGLATSITSSHQVTASLLLSDPDSSDGLAHSGSSSYSSNSSSGAVPAKHRHVLHLPRLSASSINDCVGSNTRTLISPSLANSSSIDLSAFLTYLNMPQYIDQFHAQEVDLPTLLSLNDGDLKELGISAFGHRKKLLIAIKNATSSLSEFGQIGSNSTSAKAN